MPKFESSPNMNNTELNSNEVEAGKKLGGELIPEELEKFKTKDEQEQIAEKPKLPLEEQLKNLESEAETKREETDRLSESIKGKKFALNTTREKLGLPPTEKYPSSIFSENDKLEKLRAEQDDLDKQKEELISQQERDRLIREEKEKILQEKINEVFKEFEGLNPHDFESIFKSGKTTEGRNVESKSMGSLEPEIAQSLAKAFKEGIKLLPKILETLPELLKNFDKKLTKEAIERVDKKLEEEKQRLEEEQQKEEKPSEPNIGEKPKMNPIEGGNIENPEA